MISRKIASHFSLQNYGFSIMQHSVFLTCNFLQKVLAKNNLATTAKALYLHRNTLIYRLDRMATMLNVELKDLNTNELFYLLFSCMLVEYL
ncbi:hypothetical protein DOZ58_06215 [Acetobacterium sp. KB-1]|jgi:Regulator of polyketide synthase expression|nr:hypothetical protein DOZ58_06215 [Acetobacterium sp. KB-1]